MAHAAGGPWSTTSRTARAVSRRSAWPPELLDVLPQPAFLFEIGPDTPPGGFAACVVNARARTLLAGDEMSVACMIATMARPYWDDVVGACRTVRFEQRLSKLDLLVELELQPLADADGSCSHIIGVLRDHSEHGRVRRSLDHERQHDQLTGLPNRQVLAERIDEAVARRATGSCVGVLFVDLDRFRLVNEGLGHEWGDTLLAMSARRVEANLRAGDTLARFGGDQFAIVCPDVAGLDHALAIAARVLAAIRDPFSLPQGEVFLTASVGLVVTEDTDERPEQLLRDANVAMSHAKKLGRDRVAVFDEQMRARAAERLDVEKELRGALARQEFRVFYQPFVQFSGSEVIGFEALLRWEHPERGLIGPNEFIPVAEETGLIVDIGAWVLHEVCHQAAVWAADVPGTPPLHFSVNLSARQLAHPDLIATVAEALAVSGIDPPTLSLEITESVLMDDPDLAIVILHALRDLGVRLSIDDFGQGHSSLGYLRSLPVDCVKIDRTFVEGLDCNPDDSAIVSAVVGLGHALGLTVTAEGVETPEQLDRLRSLGCDIGQGFYFARPQPSAVSAALVRHRLRWRQVGPAA